MNRWILTRRSALLAHFGWPRRKKVKQKSPPTRSRRLIVERLEAKRLMTALYWDPDGIAGNNNVSTGAGLGGDGAWTNGGAAVWYNPATGQDVAWNNAHQDAAHFDGTAGSIGISGQVAAGSIVFDVDGNSISGGSLLLPDSGMPVSIASGSATIASVLTGNGLLTKSGAGTIALSAENTFSGGSEISGGTLLVQNYSLPAGGNINVAAGATLHYDTSAGDLAQPPTTFTGGGTLLVDGGNTLTFGGAGGNVIVSFSAGALIDVETGTLVGSNSYEGQWTTNAASLNVASGATFDAAEANARVDALTGGGTFEAGLGAVTETVGVAGGSGDFSGTIQDNGTGSVILVKAGAGTETLSGNNSYSGLTETQGGTLVVQNNGVPSGGGLSVGNTAPFEQQTPTADLYWDPDGIAGNNNVSTGTGLGGDGTWSNGGAAVWYNPATGQDVAWDNAAYGAAHFLGTAGAVSVSGQASAAALDFASDGYTISGGALLLPDVGTSFDIGAGTTTILSNVVGTGELTKTGDGSAVLTADNTFSGGTEISGGSLVTQNYSLPAGGDIDVAGGATLHYDTSGGDMQQMPTTFTGSGTLLVDGGHNLTFGGTGGSVDVSFNPGALIDVEAGALVASAYHNGQWSGNSASLNIASGATLAGGDGNITIDALTGSGTLVGGSGSATDTIGVAGDSGTFSGSVQNNANGTVAVIKTGSGTQALTGSNSYSGGTTVDQGVLQTNMAAGRGNNVQYVLSGLQAGGTYEVYATWTADSSLNANVPYQILDGSTVLDTVLIDQQNAPSGTTINGVIYQSLGQFLVSDTVLTISVLSTTFGAAQIGAVIAQQRTGDQIAPESTYRVRLLEADGSQADVGDAVPLTVGVTASNPTGSAYVQNINAGTIQAKSWEEAVDLLVSGEASFNSITVNFPDDLAAVPGFLVGTVAELSNMANNELGGSVGLAADTKVIALEDGSYASNSDSSNAPPSGTTETGPDYDDAYWIVVVTKV